MKLIYGIKDKPKFGQNLVFAIQQLLAIMTATLVVPVITGNGMQPAAALFGAGAGTLVYVLFTKASSPVFLGSSFAFLGSMAAAFAGAATVEVGYLGLILGAIFAGLVYVAIAIVVKIVGVGWVNKLMPAVVIGPTVSIIGLSLAGNAVGDLVKGNISRMVQSEIPAETIATIKGALSPEIAATIPEKLTTSVSASFAAPLACVVCGIITLIVVALCSTFGKKTARMIPFIIGILVGYAVAGVMTIIGFAAGIDALKILNIEPFRALVADGVTLSTFITIPKFTFLTALGGFKEITGSYIGTIAVAYVPVAFVVFAEHIADHKNISSIIEKDLLEDPGLSRTLLGDGIGSMVGAIFGGCPNTTYGESVGCVAISGCASVSTIILTAICAIVVSFVSPFVAFVNSIPSCVMGGVCMALYGFIAVSGLKMVQEVDLNENRNLFVVSTILIAGIGGLTLTFGKVTITSIAAALILGIIVNIVLAPADKKKD